MSNFYKHTYVVSGAQVRRVINTNEMVKERMRELSQQKEQMQNLSDGVETDGEAENASDGFQEGLLAEQIEVAPEPQGPTGEEILAQANEQAEQILAQANEQAGQILAQANEQAGQIKADAQTAGHKEGYADGQAKANEEINAQKEQMMQELELLQQQYNRNLESMEPELLDTMLSIFDEVFHIQFSDKREILLSLVQNAMRGIKETKQYRIRVSEAQVDFLREKKPLLQEKVGDDLTIEIVTDSDLTEGQCMIDADSGVYNCSLDVELDHLIRDLKSLSIRS